MNKLKQTPTTKFQYQQKLKPQDKELKSNSGEICHHETKCWGTNEMKEFEVLARFIHSDWQPNYSVDLLC